MQGDESMSYNKSYLRFTLIAPSYLSVNNIIINISFSNIQSDRPTDQASRWSSDSNYPPQVM